MCSKRKKQSPAPTPVPEPAPPVPEPAPPPAEQFRAAVPEQQVSAETLLSKQMGPGYGASTPGLEALAELQRGTQQLEADVAAGAMAPAEATSVLRQAIEERAPTELPVRPSIPIMTLADLARYRSMAPGLSMDRLDVSQPRRFVASRYGVR